MAIRFVAPETRRITLSGGDYIEVKKYLNVKETRAMLARQMKSVGFGEKPQLDPEQVGVAKVAAYLIDWGGPNVPAYSEAALDNLDAESFTEIFQAIEQHETEMDAAREAVKNPPSGESAPSATSPSAG